MDKYVGIEKKSLYQKHRSCWESCRNGVQAGEKPSSRAKVCLLPLAVLRVLSAVVMLFFSVEGLLAQNGVFQESEAIATLENIKGLASQQNEQVAAEFETVYSWVMAFDPKREQYPQFFQELGQVLDRVATDSMVQQTSQKLPKAQAANYYYWLAGLHVFLQDYARGLSLLEKAYQLVDGNVPADFERLRKQAFSAISLGAVPLEQSETIEEQSEATEEQSEATEEQDEVAEEQDEVAEEQDEVAEEQDEVAEEQDEATEKVETKTEGLTFQQRLEKRRKLDRSVFKKMEMPAKDETDEEMKQLLPLSLESRQLFPTAIEQYEGVSPQVANGNYDEAAEVLSDLVGDNPQFYEAAYALAVVFLLKEDYENANRYFTQTIESKRSVARAYLWRAVALAALERLNEAVDDLVRARAYSSRVNDDYVFMKSAQLINDYVARGGVGKFSQMPKEETSSDEDIIEKERKAATERQKLLEKQESDAEQADEMTDEEVQPQETDAEQVDETMDEQADEMTDEEAQPEQADEIVDEQADEMTDEEAQPEQADETMDEQADEMTDEEAQPEQADETMDEQADEMTDEEAQPEQADETMDEQADEMTDEEVQPQETDAEQADEMTDEEVQPQESDAEQADEMTDEEVQPQESDAEQADESDEEAEVESEEVLEDAGRILNTVEKVLDQAERLSQQL